MVTDSADHQDALTVLPDLLRQTNGLRRLFLHFSGNGSPQLSPIYRYDQIFPAFSLWPALMELSLSGFAIGGWDIMKPVLGHRRLRRLQLSEIDLLDGTWEGVIDCLHRLSRVTELNMNMNLTHCGGVIFRPSGGNDNGTDSDFLRRIENYVRNGGRHPCLTLDCHTHTTLWCYQDLTPEKDFEKMKLSFVSRVRTAMIYSVSESDRTGFLPSV